MKLRRDEKIYQEIEAFADYELTQCIVYEMAIRNNGIQTIKEDYKIFDDKCVNDDIDPDGCPGFRTQRISKDKDGVTIEGENVRVGYCLQSEIKLNADDVSKFENSLGRKIETQKDYMIFYESDYFDHYEDVHYAKTNIVENFKRPKMILPDIYVKKATATIDLSRPLDELIAYLTHVKQDIDKNTKLIKAPIELVGEKLQLADDISKMCTETKNGKVLCFDGRKGVTRTQKLADMFFIYDAVKLGYRELLIRTEISEYYRSIGKSTDMSDKTFRKYRDIAIDYIDNERFSELVIGVKQ